MQPKDEDDNSDDMVKPEKSEDEVKTSIFASPVKNEAFDAAEAQLQADMDACLNPDPF